NVVKFFWNDVDSEIKEAQKHSENVSAVSWGCGDDGENGSRARPFRKMLLERCRFCHRNKSVDHRTHLRFNDPLVNNFLVAFQKDKSGQLRQLFHFFLIRKKIFFKKKQDK